MISSSDRVGHRLLVVLVVLLLVLLLILLLVRLLLDLALQGRSGDSVQVTPVFAKDTSRMISPSDPCARPTFEGRSGCSDSLSVDADLPATVSGLLEHTDLLQRLEDGPLDTGSGVLVVRGPVSTTVGTSVELGEGTDTDVLPEVDVSGDRGCARGTTGHQASATPDHGIGKGGYGTHRLGRSTSRGCKEPTP